MPYDHFNYSALIDSYICTLLRANSSTLCMIANSNSQALLAHHVGNLIIIIVTH
jgi:hypothetical protein